MLQITQQIANLVNWSKLERGKHHRCLRTKQYWRQTYRTNTGLVGSHYVARGSAAFRAERLCLLFRSSGLKVAALKRRSLANAVAGRNAAKRRNLPQGVRAVSARVLGLNALLQVQNFGLSIAWTQPFPGVACRRFKTVGFSRSSPT